MDAPFLQGLDHVQLPVHDLVEAIRWYQDVLGFVLMDDYGRHAMLRLAGGPDLMLWHGDAVVPVEVAHDGETRPVFFFRTADADALRRRLQDERARVSDVQDLGFARFLRFHDPAGNQLGAVEHTPSTILRRPENSLH